MTRNIVLLVTLSIALSGCGSKWLEEEFYNSQIIQARDYAPYGPKFHPAPVYCYKTLAGADCYSTPQPRRREQLIEFYPDYPPVCCQKNEVAIGSGPIPMYTTEQLPLETGDRNYPSLPPQVLSWPHP